MNVHAKYLSLDHVRELATPLLGEQFNSYDFKTINLSETETFDGVPVLQIVVDLGRKAPVDTLVDALDALHSKLRSEGEDRLVFLSTNVPSSDQETTGENEEDVE